MTVIEHTQAAHQPVVSEPMVNISQTAAKRLLTMMNEKDELQGHALRIFVAGGGCSGLQYGMAFDNNIQEGDEEFTCYDLRVLVDPLSARYLRGANVDYVDTILGSGFKIDNPNASNSCGCGQSFSTQDEGYSEEETAQNTANCSGCPSY